MLRNQLLTIFESRHFLLVPTNQWKCRSGVWHTNVAMSKQSFHRFTEDKPRREAWEAAIQ